MTTDLKNSPVQTETADQMRKELTVLKERINSQQDMLERTTGFMSQIQSSLEQSKQKVEEKNKETLDSMRYAERLQQAILPSCDEVNKAFIDSFIYLRQCEIIGGDLAYFIEAEDSYFIAAIDCTGHGIPGAMISMMAHSLLDEIIMQHLVFDPGHILTELNRMLFSALNGGKKEIKDGLDISLCRVHKDTKKVSFSGARRPLLHLSIGASELIKATRASIAENPDSTFETIDIEGEGKNKFYMFSDGIPDQFGGPKGKKFGTKRLVSLISEIKMLNMKKQSEIITNTITSWQANEPQIDDNLIIGFCI